MIYVFSYQTTDKTLDGVEYIYLNSIYPLRQIYSELYRMKNDDIVIMLPEALPPLFNYLEKTIPLYYKDRHKHLIALSPDDPEKHFILLNEDKFKSTDTIMFKRGEMRSSLGDFSGYSPYNHIRERIISLFSNGSIYAPSDRYTAKKEPEIARSHNDIMTYDVNIPIGDIYKTTINIGLGDMIYTRGILDNQKHKFKKVVISPNINVYNTLISPSQADTDFTYAMLHSLFRPPYYEIVEPNKLFPHRFAYTFHAIENFPVIKPNLEDELCEGTPLHIGPYLLINTRIREITKKEYEKSIKDRLMKTLRKLSRKYKIVVLGERSLRKCLQHDVFSDMMFVIYNDIKKAVPRERLVDLTFESFETIASDRIKKIKQECLYMRDADWNITFGNGGNFCMATAVGKVIGYYTPDNRIDATPLAFKNTSYAGIHVVDNLNKFFEKLDSLLNDNKPVMKIKVNMGIGDLLLIRAMLDYKRDSYSKIYITPNTEFFDKLRTTEYKNGPIKDYIKWLFDDPSYYKIDNNLTYPRKNTETLFWEDKIQFKGPQYMRDKFCKGKSLNIGDYVTITTKIRAINKKKYESIKEEFFKTLSKVSEKYKVVILGEKTLPDWTEYKDGTTNDVFVIYDDIIKYLPKDNIIDMTIDTIHDSSLKQLQQDCVYLRDAYQNIILGLGGGFCLTLVAGKILGYWQPHTHSQVTELYEYCTNFKSNMYMTRDFEKFIYWLGEL
jgi:hypothetical protein